MKPSLVPKKFADTRKGRIAFRSIIGEPTPVMRAMGSLVDKAAIAARVKEFVSPSNRFVKEEPFKRYTYEKRNGAGGGNGEEEERGNRRPRVFAALRGKGSGNGAANGFDPAIPYRTEWPAKRDREYQAEVARGHYLWTGIRLAMQAARLARPLEGNADIDEYLLGRVRNERFGIGF